MWDVKLETCFLLFAAYTMGFYFGYTLFYQDQRGLVCFSIACVFEIKVPPIHTRHAIIPSDLSFMVTIPPLFYCFEASNSTSEPLAH